MNYLETDYYVLVALARTRTTTADQLLREMYRDLGWLSCADNLAAALAVLATDGYLTVEPSGQPLRDDTRISPTEKGLSVVAVGGPAKFFSGMRDKAIRKKGQIFCSLTRPDVRPMLLDRTSFADYIAREERSEEASFFKIKTAEDGLYEVSMGCVYDDENTEDPAYESFSNGLSVLCDPDTAYRAMNDLLDTALYFSETHHARKILLSGSGKAFVVSFCEVADDEEYPYLRVTAAPVLFNRQRFIGKRDSDLDYAQCGANVYATRLDSPEALCGLIYWSIARRTDLLDETLGQKLHALYANA